MKRWLSVVGLAFSISACTESRAPCSVPTALFFAKYTLQNQTGMCGVSPGDEVALEKYSSGPPGSSDADSHEWELALQSAIMGNMVSEPGVKPEMVRAFAIGDFPQYADDDDLCRADEFEPAEANVPERTIDFGAGSPPETFPPIHIQEEWKNVAMYNSSNVQATRFSAELVITNFEAGCETHYSVSALSPAVFCGTEQYDGEGNYVFLPDDSRCSPRPNPNAEFYVGSGIDARIETHCDSVTMYCVLDGSPLDPL